jgi:hypothetical protein
MKVSDVRDRSKVLDILLPKFLGILWRGVPGPGGVPHLGDTRLRVGGYVVPLGDELTIGGTAMDVAYMIHAYVRSPAEDWRKVFSAHLADKPFGDLNFEYWNGRCALLSWKRGLWEDRLLMEPDEPRTFAHVQTAGLSKPGRPKFSLV